MLDKATHFANWEKDQEENIWKVVQINTMH